MSDSRRRNQWVLGALVIVCVVAVAAAAWRFRRARVTGDTAEQRIASVIKIANDRPRGYAQALADAALGDPDARVRSTALACLNGNLVPDARSAVMEATHDDDPQVRESACISLMACDDQATVQRLTAICHEETDEDVRQAALLALAANESPYAAVALMTMVEQGETPELRQGAAKAMIDKVNIAVTELPEDQRTWDNMVEAFRMSLVVDAAYDQTGTPMVHDEAARHRIQAHHGEKCHCEGAPGGLSPEIPPSGEE